MRKKPYFIFGSLWPILYSRFISINDPLFPWWLQKPLTLHVRLQCLLRDLVIFDLVCRLPGIFTRSVHAPRMSNWFIQESTFVKTSSHEYCLQYVKKDALLKIHACTLMKKNPRMSNIKIGCAGMLFFGPILLFFKKEC